jgi:glutamine cyclotransferase
VAGLLCVLAVLAACTSVTPSTSAEPVRLVPVVLNTVPVAPTFVEGLALLDQGRRVLESSGAPSADEPSAIRILDVRTGAVQAEHTLPGVFAEGAAMVTAGRSAPTIWLLTWRDGVAIRLDQDLHELDRRPLTGAREGWGLCSTADGRLISSDGSDRLVIRDPATFAPVSTITVTTAGRAQTGLNELDCADGAVWANVWPTDQLLRIDQDTGHVTAIVDLTALHDREHPDRVGDPDAVPNGVALAADGTLWLSGKEFPHLMHVRLVPAPPPSPASTVARTPCPTPC